MNLRDKNEAKTLIQRFGPTTIAKRLGFIGPGASQRVSNWARRGIPAHALLDHRNQLEQLQAEFSGRAASNEKSGHKQQMGLGAQHIKGGCSNER